MSTSDSTGFYFKGNASFPEDFVVGEITKSWLDIKDHLSFTSPQVQQYQFLSAKCYKLMHLCKVSCRVTFTLNTGINEDGNPLTQVHIQMPLILRSVPLHFQNLCNLQTLQDRLETIPSACFINGTRSDLSSRVVTIFNPNSFKMRRLYFAEFEIAYECFFNDTSINFLTTTFDNLYAIS